MTKARRRQLERIRARNAAGQNPLATANTKAGRIWRRKNIPGYAERVKRRAAERASASGGAGLLGGLFETGGSGGGYSLSPTYSEAAGTAGLDPMMLLLLGGAVLLVSMN